MRQVQADLFNYPDADAICITTNGVVNAVGLAIMGRGVAARAVLHSHTLRRELGKRIQKYGNHVFVFDDPLFTMPVVSLPVKNDWRDHADPHLIMQSIRELVCIANALDWQSIALPRPGCGAGGLSWPTVEGLLCTRLDDRFVIVDLEAPCQDLL